MFYIQDIDNTRLVDFFSFIFSKSTKVSFKRSYQRGIIEYLDPRINNEEFYEIGYIEKDNFDKIQEETKKTIKGIYEGYYKEGIYPIAELKKNYEEELKTFWYVDYNKEVKNKEDLSFKGTLDEYLGNEITRYSYDTFGPFQEVCYFTIGNLVKDIVSQMNTLYDWKKFNICNEQFFDFACWRNDTEVIFFTMPCDRVSILKLTNDEYNEMFKLDFGIKMT